MGTIAAVFATASLAGGTLSLNLHYEMVCGQPGRGPLVVRLPAAFRLSTVQVHVRGEARPFTVAGRAVTISLRKPPQITCMSITEGTLRVTIASVHAPPGRYAVPASLPRFRFVAPLRVR